MHGQNTKPQCKKITACNMLIIRQSNGAGKAAGTITGKVRTNPKSEQNRILCEIYKKSDRKIRKSENENII